MTTKKSTARQVLNSALETGLRSLLLLLEAFPASSDIDRLVFFDYLAVHSADIEGGPPSLHPNTPNRSGEVLVRRALIEEGLHLMISRGLIAQLFDKTGITYKASEDAVPFIKCLESEYTSKLRDRAQWVNAKFGKLSTDELASMFRTGLERWGAEFSLELPEYEELG